MPAKKVALISLYSDDVKGIPPLALLYLATALKNHGHESKIIHKNANNSGDIVAEIEDYQPDLIGMSVFSGYNNKKYVALSRELKSKGYKIVWGNAHPSLFPEQCLREPSIDFVIIGEGEATIVDLVNKLDNKEVYVCIPSLGFKDDDGKMVINEKRACVDLDDYLIDWSLIDLEPYLIPYFSNKYKRVLTVTTSRGCPFNCQFCYNAVFNDRRWRSHSAEKIIANLQPIIDKYKIDAIRFLDDNFFVNKERAFEIACALKMPYFAEARVEYIIEDFVSKLQETKCEEIMFGFESGSDRVLKEVVCKGTSTKETIRAVTLLKGSGVLCSGSIIFGLPNETKEEYQATMKFIIKLLEINNNLAFTCGWFLPYPGTGLYEQAKLKGFKPPTEIEDWDRFDRWRNDYEMEWIEWDYKQAVKYSRKIIHLLALAHKRNIPILKTILKKRVEHLNFSLPVDIYLFSRLRYIYLYSGDKNFFFKFIKRVLTKIIKFRQKEKQQKHNTHNDFCQEKLKQIFTSGNQNKKIIIDIGGGLRLNNKQGNRTNKEQAWLKDYIKQVDYKILDKVADYNPDIVGDIHQMPLTDNSVDAIICIAVLEHVEEPQQAIREIYRVLKPGGYCFIHVPFLYYYHPMPGYYQDFYRFTYDGVKYLTRNFKEVEIKNARGALATVFNLIPMFSKKTKFFNWLDKLLHKENSKQTSGYNIFCVK